MDFIVVVLEGTELSLELALGTGKVDIDGGQFVDADDSLLVKLLGGSLGTLGLLKVDAHLLEFSGQGLATTLRDA